MQTCRAEILSCSISHQKTEDNSRTMERYCPVAQKTQKLLPNAELKQKALKPIPNIVSKYPENFSPRYESEITSWHTHREFAFELIKEHKPLTIVELGVHYGDSYFTFCQACDELELNTRLYGIDHWQGDEQAGFFGEEVFEKVKAYNDEFYKEN